MIDQGAVRGLLQPGRLPIMLLVAAKVEVTGLLAAEILSTKNGIGPRHAHFFSIPGRE